MIKFKDSERKMSDAKRAITITNVYIDGDMLCDENGPIAQGILEKLPTEIEEFTVKITVVLPEENT